MTAPWPEWRLPVRDHLRPKPPLRADFALVRGWRWVEIGEWNAKDGSWLERQLLTSDMPLDVAEALECEGQA